ncbi:MAG: hypothetical protein GX892_18170 [Thermoanaerobacteraceae bacterium]|nr:hypothetical protein [Thermoanaerobacteraceae bacterium]
MLIYNLDIQFGFGRIGIDTYKGSADPQMHIHEGFDVNTKLPDVNVSITHPIIDDIDLSQCWADMGQPQPLTAAFMWYNKAKQYVMEYLDNKVAGGDALGAIEKGISIGDIVEIESFSEPPEVNVDAIPKTPPKITFKFGEVYTKFSPGGVKVDVSDDPVTLDYERANVNIFMERNPYITIKAVPTGKNIDEIA